MGSLLSASAPDHVRIQSESAVRQLARSYPYDAWDDSDTTTLIGDPIDVNRALLAELQERADDAGVTVLEARITDLSYAPEIAEAMLRRQQASAIVAARAKIVEGAVLMVRDAVRQLEAGSADADAIPPELYEVYEAWAADELRSVNAQIEAVLADAARRAGRLRRGPGGQEGSR